MGYAGAAKNRLNMYAILKVTTCDFLVYRKDLIPK